MNLRDKNVILIKKLHQLIQRLTETIKRKYNDQKTKTYEKEFY